MTYIDIESEWPPYYKHVLFLMKDGSNILGWRASDGEENIYTIANSNNILNNEDIIGWSDEPFIEVFNVIPVDGRKHADNEDCKCIPTRILLDDRVLIKHNSLR